MEDTDKIVNVAIIDDSTITSLGLGVILSSEPQIELIASFNRRSELNDYLSDEKSKPLDVILVDISIEELTDGLDLANYLNNNYPKINAIILSHYKNKEYIVSALKAKARAFLSKDSSPRDIVAAIKTVISGGGIYFGENINRETLAKIFGDVSNIHNEKPYNLSGQELGVLTCLTKGYTTKEIAKALNVSVNTVNTYKERLFNKLDVSSVVEAIAKAYDSGLCGVK